MKCNVSMALLGSYSDTLELFHAKSNHVAVTSSFLCETLALLVQSENELKHKKHWRILDLGPGDGEVSAVFIERLCQLVPDATVEYVAIDRDRDFLAATEKKLSKFQNVQVRTYEADMYDFEWGQLDGQFDTVLASHSLYFGKPEQNKQLLNGLEGLMSDSGLCYAAHDEWYHKKLISAYESSNGLGHAMVSAPAIEWQLPYLSTKEMYRLVFEPERLTNNDRSIQYIRAIEFALHRSYDSISEEGRLQLLGQLSGQDNVMCFSSVGILAYSDRMPEHVQEQITQVAREMYVHDAGVDPIVDWSITRSAAQEWNPITIR